MYLVLIDKPIEYTMPSERNLNTNNLTSTCHKGFSMASQLRKRYVL